MAALEAGVRRVPLLPFVFEAQATTGEVEVPGAAVRGVVGDRECEDLVVEGWIRLPTASLVADDAPRVVLARAEPVHDEPADSVLDPAWTDALTTLPGVRWRCVERPTAQRLLADVSCGRGPWADHWWEPGETPLSAMSRAPAWLEVALPVAVCVRAVRLQVRADEDRSRDPAHWRLLASSVASDDEDEIPDRESAEGGGVRDPWVLLHEHGRGACFVRASPEEDASRDLLRLTARLPRGRDHPCRRLRLEIDNSRDPGSASVALSRWEVWIDPSPTKSPSLSWSLAVAPTHPVLTWTSSDGHRVESRSHSVGDSEDDDSHGRVDGTDSVTFSGSLNPLGWNHLYLHVRTERPRITPVTDATPRSTTSGQEVVLSESRTSVTLGWNGRVVGRASFSTPSALRARPRPLVLCPRTPRALPLPWPATASGFSADPWVGVLADWTLRRGRDDETTTAYRGPPSGPLEVLRRTDKSPRPRLFLPPVALPFRQRPLRTLRTLDAELGSGLGWEPDPRRASLEPQRLADRAHDPRVCLRPWRSSPSPTTSTDPSLRPRTEDGAIPPGVRPFRALLCHDCGPSVYQEDAFVFGWHGPDTAALPFRFTRWALCDLWVYFSHARVSIPPVGWTAAAHQHGCKSLGVILTEWADGRVEQAELASDAATAAECAEALARLAEYFGFDGWLVNLEAPLEPSSSSSSSTSSSSTSSSSSSSSSSASTTAASIAAIERFVTLLRDAVVRRVPHGEVIWYDALSAVTGRVEWQRCVNEHNMPFADTCGSLFLDYRWTPEALDRSRAALEHSRLPPAAVFVGVDVWGRGSWGGGQWNCVEAVHEAALARGFSVALFAPGWLYEHEGGRDSDKANRRLDRRFFDGDDEDRSNDDDDGDDDESRSDTGSSSAASVRVWAADARAWRATRSGGDGWQCVEAEDDGERRVDEAADGVPADAIEWVTSFGWSEAEQVWTVRRRPDDGLVRVGWPSRDGDRDDDVDLPVAAAEEEVFLEVSEEFRGTPPNNADPFLFFAELRSIPEDPRTGNHDDDPSDGLTVRVEHPAELAVGSDVWTRVCLPRLPLPREGSFRLRIVHGGRDAEHWAGHFGVRMRRLQVRLLAACRPRTLAPHRPPSARPLASVVAARPLPMSSFPLHSCFCEGFGSSLARAGERVVDRPWLDLRLSSLLPSFQNEASRPPAAWQRPLAQSLASQALRGGSLNLDLVLGTASLEASQRAWEGGSVLRLHASPRSTTVVRVWKTDLDWSPVARSSLVSLVRWKVTAAAPTVFTTDADDDDGHDDDEGDDDKAVALSVWAEPWSVDSLSSEPRPLVACMRARVRGVDQFHWRTTVVHAAPLETKEGPDKEDDTARVSDVLIFVQNKGTVRRTVDVGELWLGRESGSEDVFESPDSPASKMSWSTTVSEPVAWSIVGETSGPLPAWTHPRWSALSRLWESSEDDDGHVGEEEDDSDSDAESDAVLAVSSSFVDATPELAHSHRLVVVRWSPPPPSTLAAAEISDSLWFDIVARRGTPAEEWIVRVGGDCRTAVFPRAALLEFGPDAIEVVHVTSAQSLPQR